MTDIDKARDLGSNAFHTGAMRIPAIDHDFNSLLHGKRRTAQEAIELLNAWLGAWDKANLEAPVEDNEDPWANDWKPR